MKYPTYEQIVSNIRALIEQKGMKQCVVAERAGIKPEMFCDMLNNRRKLIRIEHIPAIACALGVELKDLFYRSVKEPHDGLQTLVKGSEPCGFVPEDSDGIRDSGESNSTGPCLTSP